MSCHGRKTGLGSEIGVEKQKEMKGKKGRNRFMPNPWERGRKELLKRDVLERELDEVGTAEVGRGKANPGLSLPSLAPFLHHPWA